MAPHQVVHIDSMSSPDLGPRSKKYQKVGGTDQSLGLPPLNISGSEDDGSPTHYGGSNNIKTYEMVEEFNDESQSPGDESEEHAAENNIGYLGAFAIGVNSLCGPALLQLPFQYQQSGIIPTSVSIVLVGILAYFVTMHMSNVVSKIPGNSQFEKAIEFSDPFEVFWSRKAFLMCQAVFFLCTVCLNIAAIVDTAEVVDSFLGHTIGSAALAVDQNEIQYWDHGPCNRTTVKTGACQPYGGVDDDGVEYSNYLITAGYGITMIFFLPICLLDLKENASWQIFAFFVTGNVSVLFIVSFILHGLSMDNLTWWGHSYSGLLGAILFNYSLVLAMPALLSSKKRSVDTTTVVGSSVVVTTILYFLVGMLGAMSMSSVNINMLEPMVSGAYGRTLQWAGWFFAFFIIGLDIPLFCVLTRFNLTQSGLCSSRTANIMVVYLPWSLSWIFYQGDSIAELLSWGGILFTSAVAFLLPLYLALRTLIMYPDAKGSLHVYGGWIQSRETQIRMLYFLLLAASVAVCLGILGQADADIKKEEMRFEASRLRNGTASP